MTLDSILVVKSTWTLGVTSTVPVLPVRARIITALRRLSRSNTAYIFTVQTALLARLLFITWMILHLWLVEWADFLHNLGRYISYPLVRWLAISTTVAHGRMIALMHLISLFLHLTLLHLRATHLIAVNFKIKVLRFHRNSCGLLKLPVLLLHVFLIIACLFAR